MDNILEDNITVSKTEADLLIKALIETLQKHGIAVQFSPKPMKTFSVTVNLSETIMGSRLTYQGERK